MHQTTADNPLEAANAVAEVYARSAFDLAAQAGDEAVTSLADELDQIAALLREQDDLRNLFTNPSVNTDRRAQSIETMFKGRVSDLTYKLLQVLNRKGRLDQLVGVAVVYDQIVKDERGEVDVDVYAATALDEQQTRRIADRIGALVDRKAIVRAHVDERMIGGLKVRVGDQLIDGSVATQLQKLKRRMLERGREAVRSGANAMISDEGSAT